MPKPEITDPAGRLAELAAQALKAAANSPARAVEGFLEQTLADTELLLALMKASRTQLHSACYAYLAARALPAKATTSARGPKLKVTEQPILVHEHRRAQWGTKRPAAATKISKGAALAYATTSIFARQIGSGIKQVGEVTRFDVLQIKRRGLINSTVADGLLELDWPDEDKTVLHQIASEQQVTAVFNRAYKALDALGITHANQR